MLWYKSWLETRSRFLVGLVVLAMTACGTVLEYPQVVKLMPLAQSIDTTGALGRLVRQAAELQRDYRGYVWYQAFNQNLTQLGTLFAALLGSGGLLAQASGGAAIFTLSLPGTRAGIVWARTATGLAELLVVVLVPSLVIPLLSPAVGQSFSVASALVHAACLFVAGAVFFSLAVLFSTIFSDVWRPLLLSCLTAVVLGALEIALRGASGYGIFGVMSGEPYFLSGRLPWVGLLASALASAALLYGATSTIARRDF